MKNKLTHFLHLLIIQLFIGTLLGIGCQKNDEHQAAYDKNAIEESLQKADTLSAQEVYDMARQMGSGVAQDSFYTLLLENKIKQHDAVGLNDNIPFYEKLRSGNETADMKILFLKGVAADFANDMASAVNWFEKGLELAEAVKDTSNMVDNLKYMAKCKQEMGQYEEAFALGVQAISLAEQVGDLRLLADLKLDLSSYLFKNKEYEKATELALQAISHYQEIGDKEFEAQAYSRIGRIAEFQNDYATAAEYYDKAIEIFEALQIPEALVASYGQYANFWTNREDFGKTQEAAEKAYYWLKKSQLRNMEGQVASLLGYAMFKNGEVEKGIEQLDFSVEFAKKNHRAYDEMYAYETLYLIYKSQKDHFNAMKNHEKYVALKDSLLDERTRKNISELNIKYETAQKERQLAEATFQRQVVEKNYYLALTGLALISILVAGLVLRHRGRRKMLEQRNQLLAQEKELAEARELLKTKELQESEKKLNRTSKELKATASLLELKNQLIEELEMRLDNLQLAPDGWEGPPTEDTLQKMKILNDEQWQTFRDRYEERFPGVQRNLKSSYPKLTTAEIRLFLLMKLHFDNQEIADTLGISKESVWRSRQRLSNKLGLDSSRGLDGFVNGY